MDELFTTRELPLGTQEVAALLEVQSGTVHQWRQRGIFPAPNARISGTPVWWSDTVIAWARASGRIAG